MTEPSSLSEIDSFLQGVEGTAYRMLMVAVGNHADALDILQDSMLKLALKYSDKSPSQWKPLFYKIVQNNIRDWQRRQKVRNTVLFWRHQDQTGDEGDNWLENHAAAQSSPDGQLQDCQRQQLALQTLKAMPEKQRQCFLLRTWEGMSVAETAEVMGCSQGSVKTHLFRATNKFKHVMGELYEIPA